MLVDKVFISWIGPSSLGVERNGVVKGFSLEEGQVVPPEFKVGDLVELYLEGDPTAEIWGIENSTGSYIFKHIATGKEFRTWHRAEAYKLNPLPTPTEISYHIRINSGEENDYTNAELAAKFVAENILAGYDADVRFVNATDASVSHFELRITHWIWERLGKDRFWQEVTPNGKHYRLVE